MLMNSSKFGVLFLCLFIVACGSSPKKDKVVEPSKVDAAPAKNTAAPVLTEVQKKQYLDAVAALKSGDYATAETMLNDLLNVIPNLAGAHVNIGLIKRAQGNEKGALAAFETALQHNPNNISALLQLSNAAQKEGRFLDSEAYLKRAHSVNSEDSLVNYNMGVLYELYLQDIDKAIKHYSKYVQLGRGDDIETVKRWIMLLERK